MEMFLKTILALSLAGTVLALILMLVNRFLGKRVYSGFIYYAWMLVLLRFILPVPGLLSFPAGDSSAEGSKRAETAAAAVSVSEQPYYGYGAEITAAPYTDISNAERLDAVNAAAREEEARDQAETPAAAADEKDGAAAAFPFWLVGICLWAAGAAGTAGWNLYGYYRYRSALYGTLRPAKERDMRVLHALHPWPWPVLYRSGAVDTPLLMGFIRPVIILPDRDYTPGMLDGILRHELTHYRRGDLIIKWFAAGVCCVHWFNPFMGLFRSALDRACELSCDERLLHNMDKNEKQNYGELLLSLAANRSLPRQVVAVSFATEKRNLKERLVQIMTFKKKGFAAVSIMLAVLILLAGCAMAMGPADEEGQDGASGAREQVTVTDSDAGTVYVDSVDSFLAALGSDRRIILREGTYDLTKASDYGKTGNGTYEWGEVYDGFELIVYGVERMSVETEAGAEAVSIVTQPRYADVLQFEGSMDIALNGFTAGHTPEQGECCGGVLNFNGCERASVNDCVLFGCGTEGITAEYCRQIIADNTVIKECSYGAIYTMNSYDIRFINGKIYDCGLKSGGCFNMLDATTTTGLVVYNTEIYGNEAQTLMYSSNSAGVEMRGCRVHDNHFGKLLSVDGNAVTIDGCSLKDNAVTEGIWYSNRNYPAIDQNGSTLSEKELLSMEWAEYKGTYDGPKTETVPVTFTLGDDGRAVYHVTTVDEFLGAIGSNRVIYLDADHFDLSTAKNYGGYGGTNFYWADNYDGPGLVIAAVENMDIIGMGKDKTTVEALPRYADVLSFIDCMGITVKNLTAGHVRDKGSCSGDVLSFENCSYCTVEGCGLFGCGVNGINAYNCYCMTVKDTEIYECSEYGAVIDNCDQFAFEGSSIHDCGNDKIVVSGYGEVTWDGKTKLTAGEMFTTWD